MKTKPPMWIAAATATLFCLAYGVHRAQAGGLPVFDAANLTQNILTAIRTLQSNMNEAQQIVNQMQSLENEFLNLESLEFSVIDDYRSQFESCVLHNVLMAQAFVPAMIARKWGRVIAINTECALQCWPSQSAYAAGKRGMDGVLRVLAREVGEHGVTVNQVAPGWMVSETRGEEGRPDWYRQAVPLKRYGHDQDIANAVAFLASDLAGFITGAFLPVCGGNVMVGI